MESLLTVKELAGILKKSDRAVRLLRHRGVLPEAVKVGASVYFREKDIKEMLERREIQDAKGEK